MEEFRQKLQEESWKDFLENSQLVPVEARRAGAPLGDVIEKIPEGFPG